MYILELEDRVWLAPWDGDPGRTLDINNAIKFINISGAFKELKYARKFRPFKHAKVVAI